ncbi:related to RSN1 - Overexpression rescues sro7/sop1 in NaCl [Cephalotrichum gorgonifer]|uniref:Related to RSN1 - Overexpression rescues sro7/sop1 in NaCl n=1 Tax=Cephalotrichum gorgonifer TaxID=2041049 RepID=A0AAE8N7W1_9PEZI|nr:related to RSN1 - Overexpression rescues sro7/sop1 in NaCl [Cephalotrichum gorgonifer]
MSWPPPLLARAPLDIGEGSDPRVGSAQDNSTGGGTLSKIDVSNGDPSSLSSLFSTLLPVLIFAIVCMLIFWCLRHRMPRVYRPRTMLSTLLPQERSDALPNTWFNWVKAFIKVDDKDVLHRSTLDAYLFLRYLRMLSLITFTGVCLTWPVLLPVHSKGGGNNSQLDSLTMGNVAVPSLYFVHVLVAYLFFGFIMFTIYRECIFYINLRHAYLMSPYQSKRLSSRTVLFLCVPQRYLDERRLRKVFGDGVKNVWIPKDVDELEKLVDERDQTARRLERAEIRLIKMANERRNKQLKAAAASSSTLSNADNTSLPTSTPSSPEIDVEKTALPSSTTDELPAGFPDVNGSVAAQWIRAPERPHHRPVANYFRRVDTIKWTRNRLKLLSPRIKKAKRRLLMGAGKPIPAAFIEFATQAEAEAAYQTQAHHRPNFMSPRFIGVRPDEVVWEVLGMQGPERIARRFAMLGVITAAIVFWSFPAAFVGAMSNIGTLAEMIPFLGWIMKLPKAITGLLQGFLPALALSLLMALVPWMLRFCARVAGVPSLSHIELFVQNAYFAFQVVQVFLVTTLTSAASGALTSVIKDPLSAKDLLAEKLPTSSNFYISYILIQCLAFGASGMVHLVDIFRHYVIAKRMGSPRVMFNTWHKVRVIHWGAIFPVFTNMGVIAISYSCIAPLILGFATLGIYVIYLAYRYNLLYVYNTSIDTRGLVYPRALMQLIVGLYLAEVCMIGLFALRSAFAPMVLMVLFLVFSVLMHLSISDSITPLMYNLPRTLSLESDELAGGEVFDIGRNEATTAQPHYPFDVEEGKVAGGPEHGPTSDRGMGLGVEGADGAVSSLTDAAKGAVKTRVRSLADSLGLTWAYGYLAPWIRPERTANPNFLLRFLHPGTFDDFAALQAMLPPDMPDPTESYPEDYAHKAYWPPVMTTPMESLWIPRDKAGVSRQEVRHTQAAIPITDEGSWLEEDGAVRVDLDKAPYQEVKILY